MKRPSIARLLAAACLLAGAAAHAEVKQASTDSMQLVHSGTLNATPAAVYEAVGRVERWWSSAHTYSGSAANLSLRLEAGGCFCEKWKDGSVEHGRVLLALPGQALRLDAPLGPLQGKAVSAVLTLSLKPEGSNTQLTVGYRVNGSAASELDKDAQAVDGVLAEQIRRLARSIDSGKVTP